MLAPATARTVGFDGSLRAPVLSSPTAQSLEFESHRPPPTASLDHSSLPVGQAVDS